MKQIWNDIQEVFAPVLVLSLGCLVPSACIIGIVLAIVWAIKHI